MSDEKTQSTAATLDAPGEAQQFVDELRAVSKSPVAYAELPNAQHGFDIFGSPRAHRSAEAVARFLSWVYATGYLKRD